MDTAKMKKNETVFDWLNYVAVNREGVETIHLNQLDNGRCEQLTGSDLIRYVTDILYLVSTQLQKMTQEHGVKHAVIFLHISVTEELMRWTPQIWERLNCENEPPSLYLIRDVQIFDDDCEEYRRPIYAPNGEFDKLKIIFRSFRNQESIENSWEFTSGIYLIAHVE